MILAILLSSPSGHTQSVAVASNFYRTMQTLASAFETETGHEVLLVSGSTGGLYAQIVNGAPYDLFIAADSERPTRLASAGLGIAETQRTLAYGQLAIWSDDEALVRHAGLDVLQDEQVKFLAIANPDLAPYGKAAQQTLMSLNQWDRWAGRLAYGQNVAQAYAMVVTGGAQIGLIAHSQALASEHSGRFYLIPESHHEPIRQDIILLARGAENAAVRSLLEYLSSTNVRNVIRSAGYRVDD